MTVVPTTPPTQTGITPRPNSLKSILEGENVKKRFAEVLKDRAPQFITSLTTLVHASKQLSECDPMSVIGAALVAASLDLPIDRNLGFSAIVPYGKQAQFQMQWKGYIQLAHRTGEYEALHVTEVYEGMVLEADPWTGEIKKGTKGGNTITGYYAYFRLRNGFGKEVYMTTEEIHAHAKRYSKTYGQPGSTWTKDFDAMARKTVIKRLLTRWGILSIEMQRAIKEEIIEEGGDDTVPLTIEQRETMKQALYGDDNESATTTIEGDYTPTPESIAETQAALDAKRQADAATA
jgi:recombination protein RecT